MNDRGGTLQRAPGDGRGSGAGTSDRPGGLGSGAARAGIPDAGPRRPIRSPIGDAGALDATSNGDGSVVPEQRGGATGSERPQTGMLPGAVVPPVEPGQVPTSAWITSDPPRPGRSIFSRVVTVVLIAIGLAVVAAIVGLNLQLFQPRGHVLFGTASGPDLCSVGGETRSVTSADPIYFAAILNNPVEGDQAIRLTITRDGVPVFDHTDPPIGTAFQCYGSREPYGPYEPGTYVFEVTQDGEVEATGTLTVT